jgi:hypothetical protein
METPDKNDKILIQKQTEQVRQVEQKYILSQNDIGTITYYVKGWWDEWIQNCAKYQGTCWIGRCNLYYISVVLLAKSERLLKTNNKYSNTILYGMYNGGWLKYAHNVVNNEHEFMFRHSRYYYKKYESNNHISYGEEKTPLNNASLWTIVKAFRTQLLASIDNLYQKNMRGEPLMIDNIRNNKIGKRQTPVRTPEDGSFKGIVDMDLINVIYNLADTYNNVLKSTVTLGIYYKYANTLRPNNKKRVNIKKNIRQRQPQQNTRVRVSTQ